MRSSNHAPGHSIELESDQLYLVYWSYLLPQLDKDGVERYLLGSAWYPLDLSRQRFEEVFEAPVSAICGARVFSIKYYNGKSGYYLDLNGNVYQPVQTWPQFKRFEECEPNLLQIGGLYSRCQIFSSKRQLVTMST